MISPSSYSRGVVDLAYGRASASVKKFFEEEQKWHVDMALWKIETRTMTQREWKHYCHKERWKK